MIVQRRTTYFVILISMVAILWMIQTNLVSPPINAPPNTQEPTFQETPSPTVSTEVYQRPTLLTMVSSGGQHFQHDFQSRALSHYQMHKQGLCPPFNSNFLKSHQTRPNSVKLDEMMSKGHSSVVGKRTMIEHGYTTSLRRSQEGSRLPLVAGQRLSSTVSTVCGSSG
jgi:hypothetical protein